MKALLSIIAICMCSASMASQTYYSDGSWSQTAGNQTYYSDGSYSETFG